MKGAHSPNARSSRILQAHLSRTIHTHPAVHPTWSNSQNFQFISHLKHLLWTPPILFCGSLSLRGCLHKCGVWVNTFLFTHHNPQMACTLLPKAMVYVCIIFFFFVVVFIAVTKSISFIFKYRGVNSGKFEHSLPLRWLEKNVPMILN